MWTAIGILMALIIAITMIVIWFKKKSNGSHLSKEQQQRWLEGEKLLGEEIQEAEAVAKRKKLRLNENTEDGLRRLAARETEANAKVYTEAEENSDEEEEEAVLAQIKRSNKGSPFFSLIFLLLPLSLAAPQASHAKKTEKKICIKKASWLKIRKALNKCEHFPAKCKLLIDKARGLEAIGCDRRIKQCMAATALYQKKVALLLGRKCPSSVLPWVLVGVVGALAIGAGIAAGVLYVRGRQ